MGIRSTMKIIVLSLTMLGGVSAGRAEEIKIAVVGPMTGALADIGEQIRQGAELAAHDINAASGIDGNKILLSIEDDACDPKQAVSVANRVVGDEIKLVDGHVCSGASISASEVYAENSVLMMTPATVNSKLTDGVFAKGWTTIMRLYARDDAQGELIGSWIAARCADRRIAFLHDKSAYGRGLADQVKAQMNARGVKEILFEGINPGEKDYTAVIGKLKTLRAEVVYYGGYPTEGGLIMRQAADQGFKFQMVGTSGFVAPIFWSIAGSAGEAALFPFPTDPRQLSTAKRITEELQAIGSVPESFTLFSYATVQALAEGVQRAGKVDAVAIAQALRTGMPVNTVLGPIAFDAKGDAQGMTYDINVWHDGRHMKLP